MTQRDSLFDDGGDEMFIARNLSAGIPQTQNGNTGSSSRAKRRYRSELFNDVVPVTSDELLEAENTQDTDTPCVHSRDSTGVDKNFFDDGAGIGELTLSAVGPRTGRRRRDFDSIPDAAPNGASDAVTLENLEPGRWVEYRSPDGISCLYYNASTLLRIGLQNALHNFGSVCTEAEGTPVTVLDDGSSVVDGRYCLLQPPHFRERISSDFLERIYARLGGRRVLFKVGSERPAEPQLSLQHYNWVLNENASRQRVNTKELYVCPYCFEWAVYLTNCGRDSLPQTTFLNESGERAASKGDDGITPFDPLDVISRLDIDLQAPLLVFSTARVWREHLNKHHGSSTGFNAGDHRLRDYIANNFTARTNMRRRERLDFASTCASTARTYWSLNMSFNVTRYNRLVRVCEEASTRFENRNKDGIESGLPCLEAPEGAVIISSVADCALREYVHAPDSCAYDNDEYKKKFFMTSTGEKVVNPQREIPPVLVGEELMQLLAVPPCNAPESNTALSHCSQESGSNELDKGCSNSEKSEEEDSDCEDPAVRRTAELRRMDELLEQLGDEEKERRERRKHRKRERELKRDEAGTSSDKKSKRALLRSDDLLLEDGEGSAEMKKESESSESDTESKTESDVASSSSYTSSYETEYSEEASNEQEESCDSLDMRERKLISEFITAAQPANPLTKLQIGERLLQEKMEQNEVRLLDTDEGSALRGMNEGDTVTRHFFNFTPLEKKHRGRRNFSTQEVFSCDINQDKINRYFGHSAIPYATAEAVSTSETDSTTCSSSSDYSSDTSTNSVDEE